MLRDSRNLAARIDSVGNRFHPNNDHARICKGKTLVLKLRVAPRAETCNFNTRKRSYGLIVGARDRAVLQLQ